MTRRLASVRPMARAAWSWRYDGLVFLGAGAVVWGAGLIFRPVGLILAGLVVVAWGLVGSWTARRSRP